MAWLVMNDQVDYPVMYYPTHIVSKDNKILPLFIGASQTIIRGYIGLYIKDEHYDLIRHDKAYIIVHDPEMTDEKIVSIEWNKVPNAVESLATEREHIHLWKDEERGENA